MDYRLFELLNGAMRGHHTLDLAISDFATWSVPLFAAATLALWFLAPPDGPNTLKVATVSACLSAGLGLLVNQALVRLWPRERPFAAHPGATVLLAHRTRDPSFPSDHATAAFAVAFAVLFLSVRVGLLFLAGATVIGVSRVLVGLHYPGDVLAGAAIGFAAACVVTFAVRAPIERAVVLASRASDPAMLALRRSRRR